MDTKEHDETIYVAVVDGKVSHVYADRPLKFRVVAWESDDGDSVRLSSETRGSTRIDRLVVELLHRLKEAPYDDELLHGEGAQLASRRAASSGGDRR